MVFLTVEARSDSCYTAFLSLNPLSSLYQNYLLYSKYLLQTDGQVLFEVIHNVCFLSLTSSV